MGKRGAEGLRALQKNSFEILKNNEGREYLKLKYNKATKKSDGTDNEIRDNNILLSMPGSRRCPVASFKLYISKLNDSLNDLIRIIKGLKITGTKLNK